MTAITKTKLAKVMTQEKADEINQALLTILDIRNGRAAPELYPLHETTLLKYYGLRTWLDAVDYIDNWNIKEERQARLTGRDPNFVRTPPDGFIAAVWTFVTSPRDMALVWNGKDCALVINTATETKEQAE